MRKRKFKLLTMMFGAVFLFSSSLSTYGQVSGNDGGDPERESENPGIQPEQTATGESGMVVSAHPLASQVGIDVLDRGGNAIDATVAMQFALNVVEPSMSGIGGGGFMMYYDAETKDTSIVNSRERAPKGATPDMFLDESGDPIPNPERNLMGETIGVPGTLKGLETSLDKWGTLPLEELIEPAITLADEGIEVNWAAASFIERSQDKLARSAAKDVFLPDGEPLQEGDLLVQEDLAHTLRLIAEHGSDVFYNGEIAEALAEVAQEFGSSMTTEDLEEIQITIDEPIWGEYLGYEVASMPPPSSGGLTVLQLLNMFEEFDLTQYPVDSPEKYHYLTEMMHLAYADRAEYMGDPDYVDIPMEGLLDDEYVEKRVETINPDHADPNIEPGNPWDYQNGDAAQAAGQTNDHGDGETTHFTVIDKDGNMVSYTTTINDVFGNGIMVPDYGFMLNNILVLFDAEPGGANEAQPYKRALSSMSPTMIFKDDEPFMTVGSPGGMTIIMSVAQTILNAIGYDMDLKDAIEEPRIYSNQYPGIQWESGIPDDVRKQLEKMGHEWETNPDEMGNLNSIIVDQDEGVYYGAADSSREGMAIGFQESNDEEEQVERPYINGHSDGTFRPGEAITRAQMAAMLGRHLGGEEEPGGALYSDISDNHWASSEIAAVHREGIMTGDKNGQFRPDEEITRGHMAVIAYRWMQEQADDCCPGTGNGAFDPYRDLSPNHWALEEIEALREWGLMTGYGDNSFGPANPLTRAQAVTVLNILFERDKDNIGTTPTFSDVPVSYWAYADIEAAAATGMKETN